MASNNISKMMEQAQLALGSGKKQEAQEFLLRITEIDQYNEEAWLWLAATVETEEERRTCLNNVLIINSENTQAKHMLDQLNRGETMSMPGKGLGAETDLFGAQTNVTAPFSSMYDDDSGSEAGLDGPFTTAAPPTTSPALSGALGGTDFGANFGDDAPETTGPAFDSSMNADDLLSDTGSDWDDADEQADDLLQMIPAEIAATRLPGSDIVVENKGSAEASGGSSLGVKVVGGLVVLALLALVAQVVLLFV